jgi:hypothetical protein
MIIEKIKWTIEELLMLPLLVIYCVGLSVSEKKRGEIG